MPRNIDALLKLPKTIEWGTPQDFFDRLNGEFQFDLDPCATDLNHKCDDYFTIKDDGLIQSWKNKRVFMNPPYGREIGAWVTKAFYEAPYAQVIVGLIPARTDTTYFHDYICGWAELRFVCGRLKFTDLTGYPRKTGATFPSMVVVWDCGSRQSRASRSTRSGRYLQMAR